MRIGIDIDGIVANYNDAYLRLLNQRAGTNVVFKDGHPHKWWWPTEEFCFTRDHLEYSLEYTHMHPEFWRNEVKPYADAQEFLSTVADAQTFDYADNYFITARSGLGCKRATELWLRDHGYDETPTVLMSHHGKGPIVQGLGLDVVIEDSPANCDNILRHVGTDCELYMLDRPYNHGYNRREVRRVYTLAEFLKILGLDV